MINIDKQIIKPFFGVWVPIVKRTPWHPMLQPGGVKRALAIGIRVRYWKAFAIATCSTEFESTKNSCAFKTWPAAIPRQLLVYPPIVCPHLAPYRIHELACTKKHRSYIGAKSKPKSVTRIFEAIQPDGLSHKQKTKLQEASQSAPNWSIYSPHC